MKCSFVNETSKGFFNTFILKTKDYNVEGYFLASFNMFASNYVNQKNVSALTIAPNITNVMIAWFFHVLKS
jgi:hypothetical protein